MRVNRKKFLKNRIYLNYKFEICIGRALVSVNFEKIFVTANDSLSKKVIMTKQKKKSGGNRATKSYIASGTLLERLLVNHLIFFKRLKQVL